MHTDFMSSETRINLMRAFAGECQAANRYRIASDSANELNNHVMGMIFRFTARQEEKHAAVFFNLLKDSAGSNIEIKSGYPADVYSDIIRLLESSVHNENEEHINIYPTFSKIAEQEGFSAAAAKFSLIAEIENEHRRRFEYYLQLMKNDNLFRSDKTERWICLNCGHIHESSSAPLVCPVCGVRQDYFIREREAAFTLGGCICQEQ
jgi:rubrerythrin